MVPVENLTETILTGKKGPEEVASGKCSYLVTACFSPHKSLSNPVTLGLCIEHEMTQQIIINLARLLSYVI
jgi:hypothetical protein